MMNDWYEKSNRALQLAGKGERTQECYTRSVRQLVEFTGKTPDLITESELQDYFLHRRNVDHWSPNTMRISHAGIRFFFNHVLTREFRIFDYLGAQKERRLPSVLSTEEVRNVLANVRTSGNRAFLTTVYACGLRLQEGLCLEISDIDSGRRLIHVHRGKGGKDRYVPLPERLLPVLRDYWRTHRHARLLFPAKGRNGQSSMVSEEPMAIATVQGAMRDAVQAAGIIKKAVTVHTLRHSYATHLLEKGVNLRVIQRYLGHATIETTMIYLHLTQKGNDDASQMINSLMGDL